ncbi:NAD(P)H-dependent oxidoreductase [Wielerella bovis]|uniref:NAD(P)H-dependent oxidoreductase n=1 Tax=Wielerella bovis TaxID=2917790 RepID=UPI00201961C2|nr:NAD(P)H-dependent oxidoreductase [Wielerella bovis]ULJ61960.1 NAD(P)H-dependent oxidoreductase [Wielerella bovis]ULJ64138.1 NAD(P)H-dependent oxidoreductase [Wielerella bovis]ULJ67947.1 NAD(P)H-dependent oxidoreductase [Wielerella bovis]ULJ68722.1 NAD(P)H-dependent oxidoreductase [Wielerella bovis]
MTFFNKDDIINAFHYRASTRSYDGNKKIPAEDFNYILELGRLSPSSVGSEPWQFLVLQNPDLRQKIKPYCWGIPTMETSSHIVVILAKKNARYDTPYFGEIMDRRGLQGEAREKAMQVYKKFQTEDAHIADNERTLFDWASKQTYIALANMMTGAAMIGVDSCPIEGFAYQEVNQILAEAGLFDPAEWGVSVMVTFGYRDKEIRQKARKDFDEVVKFIE